MRPVYTQLTWSLISALENLTATDSSSWWQPARGGARRGKTKPSCGRDVDMSDSNGSPVAVLVWNRTFKKKFTSCRLQTAHAERWSYAPGWVYAPQQAAMYLSRYTVSPRPESAGARVGADGQQKGPYFVHPQSAASRKSMPKYLPADDTGNWMQAGADALTRGSTCASPWWASHAAQ
jgi:hypothetical protein